MGPTVIPGVGSYTASSVVSGPWASGSSAGAVLDGCVPEHERGSTAAEEQSCPRWVGRLPYSTCTALDCVDIGFIPDCTLDQLPLPAQLGASRVGGIDVNKPRIRAALAAVLALAASPDGFTVADMTAKVHAMTGQTHATYNTRHAAYDLRKLRGKQLVGKPVRTRRYYLPGPAARTISALLTLRDHVIAPILAGVQIRRHDHVPARLTPSTRTTNTSEPTWPPCSATWASSPAQPRHSPRKTQTFGGHTAHVCHAQAAVTMPCRAG